MTPQHGWFQWTHKTLFSYPKAVACVLWDSGLGNKGVGCGGKEGGDVRTSNWEVTLNDGSHTYTFLTAGEPTPVHIKGTNTTEMTQTIIWDSIRWGLPAPPVWSTVLISKACK